MGWKGGQQCPPFFRPGGMVDTALASGGVRRAWLRAMSATTPNKKSLYGSIAMLAAFLLSQFKVEVAAADIEVMLGQAVEAIQVLLGVGGFALTIWNQFFNRKPSAPSAPEDGGGR